MSFKENDKSQVSWLDVLLEGGMVLPEFNPQEPRALTIMITGTPGSGKTTLALELCYRWAERVRQKTDKWRNLHGWDSLYVTSELNYEWALEKANNMGWEHSDSVFLNLASQQDQNHVAASQHWQAGRIIVYESSILAPIYPGVGEVEHSSELARHWVQFALHGFAAALDWTHFAGLAISGHELASFLKARRNSHRGGPEVVVFDSLDTLSEERQTEVMKQIDVLRTAGPRVEIFILNEASWKGRYAFQADVIIECGTHLDREADYLVRTIEIKKARFQSHAWGRQQLKIYGPGTAETSGSEESKLRVARRNHPYRQEGGVFIYPSIHFFLSKYKRESPADKPGAMSTSIREFDEMLDAASSARDGKLGFPRGRCTGLVGMRGGHKSHLGYRCMLKHVLAESSKNRGLIISLRDDEGTAAQAIDSILESELSTNAGAFRCADLQKFDRLEIVYFPPGNITAEEMFHRIYLSLIRLKGSDKEVIVLFNSLDQLSSRFPLCAREAILVPGIIETLSAESVTSIFIGVEEPGQPDRQYGLLSMADLLIHFEAQRIKTDTYLKRWGVDREADRTSRILKLGEFQFPTVARVVRFAGGQAAGASGMLELVQASDHPSGRKGLVFKELLKSDYEF
jgi:KaiC/GvpD/RAD55 family RecA-like ATPase